MTLELTLALEQRLEHLAAKSHKSPNELALSVMEAFLAEEEELFAAVKEADEEFDQGKFFPHEQVVAHFARRFGKA